MGLHYIFKKHIMNEFIFKNNPLTMNCTMLLEEVNAMLFDFDAIKH